MRTIILMAAAFLLVLGIGFVIFDVGPDDHAEHRQTAGDETMPMQDAASLNGARHAFWAGDVAGAEQRYRDITSADKGNINAWGELGNIYFLQSRWQEAAGAYTEAALRLIEAGQLRQAAYLHVLVIQMDPAQAARIDAQLQSANESAGS